MNTQAPLTTPPTIPPQEHDPNAKQRIASNPAQSVWVDASAGTGKTKILTDRVLRLLLSDQDRPASPPERIVCITFTKAAASEMSLRITKELSHWSICEEKDLLSSLENLMGAFPSSQQIREARTLFARVIDVAGGLKIMTIHAFCQSILQKFPLEAGLSPNFTVLTNTEKREAIQMARLRVLTRAKNDPESLLGVAVRSLSLKSGDIQLMRFLRDSLKEKEQILSVFEHIPSPSDLKPALLDAVGLPKETSEDGLIDLFFKEIPALDLKALIEAFEHGSPTDQKRIPKLSHFLHHGQKGTRAGIESYCTIFLTQKNTIRKAGSKGALDYNPDTQSLFEREAQRCLDFCDRRATLHMVEDTHDFLHVAHAILDGYAQEKKQRNALDFDDLIRMTRALLNHSKTAAQWVLFKLDQGIDHLLVDEAQDTNPEQWHVIEALSDEFFHGNSARDTIERTLFVVGDEKQSIYSFQKADPDIFRKMQSMFREKVTTASKQWSDVPLTLSFRSTDAVLALVDLVFTQDDMKPALTTQNLDIHHSAHRRGMAGHVEIWPLIYGEDPAIFEPWPIPYTPTKHTSAADIMAQKIAGTIKHWLEEGRLLESENRPVTAGDIMILLRTRSAFQKNLVRALKTHAVPVAGLDRMILQDHIAVQDMIVALEFGLLPQDNLTLATLLKSPLIGWHEDTLLHFILKYPKTPSLWQALKEEETEQELYAYLLEIHSLTLTKRPFDVVSFILNSACPADSKGHGLRAFIKRLGVDAIDPLQEFLNISLDAESDKGVSVQTFVHTLKQEQQDIKREMDDESDSVRIMTVHGSKGLQAPIVFLPDTLRSSSSRDNAQQSDSKLLWPRRSGLPYPFWAPRPFAPEIFKTAKEDALARGDREYQRLLYVALTRARDELYIGGYAQTEKAKYREESWYYKIDAGISLALETGVRPPCTLRQTETGIVLSNPQTHTTPAKNHTDKDLKSEALPTWIHKNPRPDPYPPRPLQPSRPSGDMPHISPLISNAQQRFHRGNIIHTLLEFLPDLPQDQQETAAQEFVAQTGHGLTDEAQKEMIQETLKILKDPVFAPVFGEGSRAEVPVSGKLGGNIIVNGQIDRLVVTHNEVFIVDYKTNRPPPRHPKDVPLQYKKQMQTYKDVLLQIYPTHTIRTALLWTNVPCLMELE